jgi:hypothetical protein
MRKKLKIFIAYFPVILIAGQVITNLLYFIAPEFYSNYGFYLGLAFGTNLLFALFLVGFTYWFRFCTVSRYAAIAQLLFAVNYLCVQQDNLYNIIFQIVVGVLSLCLTFRFFMKKFPLCRISLFISFMSSLFATGSCTGALDRWDRITYHKIHIAHDRDKR